MIWKLLKISKVLENNFFLNLVTVRKVTSLRYYIIRESCF